VPLLFVTLVRKRKNFNLKTFKKKEHYK